MAAHLATDAAELASMHAGGEDAVQRFLAAHPLSSVMQALSDADDGSEDERVICAALDRVFATHVGATALQQALPFARAGVDSPSEHVRAFAARQLGRLLQRGAVDAFLEVVPALVRLLSDASSAVAAAALAALVTAAGSPAGLAATLAPESGLPALARHANATVRLRVCELAARMAETGADGAAAVAAAGLLGGLLAELDDGRDLLAALAALETLSQLSDTPAAAAGLGAAALGVLPRLVHAATQEGSQEPLLRARALLVCARVAGALAARDEPPPPAALAALAAALRPEGVPTQVLSAAVDAVGVLGETAGGAEEVVRSQPALLPLLIPLAFARGSGSLASELSQAAAHALATIAGAERAPEERLLSAAAEATMQTAVHDGLVAAQGAPTLAEVLFGAVRRRGQAFVEDRVAAYRLVCGLGRRQWAANDCCAHAGLLDALLDVRGEAGHRACTWRHAAVCALAGTFAASTDDAAAALGRRLAAAASAGPFGAERRDAPMPQVAVL